MVSCRPRASRIGPSIGVSLCLAAVLGAQETPRYELGEITVTAARAPAPRSETPPAVSVVTAEEIAARGAKTVADAIEAVAGLSLNDKGPDGAQVAVSIRGSTTNQVLVLVDGVRVNDALSGMADLSRIPAESIERIEVMRGGASSLYGGDAVGGVVNIITKREEAPLKLTAELGGYLPGARVSGFGFAKVQGGFDATTLLDSQKLALSWSPRVGNALLSLSAGGTRAANAFTFVDSNGEKRERENAGLLGADASAGIELPLLGGRLSASLGASYEDKGSPGSESMPTLRASEADFDGRALVRYSAERFLSDYLTIDASMRADWSVVDYEDEDDPSQEARHEVATLGFEAVQEAFASDGLSLVYGLSANYSAVRSDAVGTPARAAAGAFVEPAFALGRLTLRPSIRYDYYSDVSPNDPLGSLAAAFGAAYRLGEGDTLKLNLSRAYRAPSFNDLYWPAIGGAEGDPGLSPETAYEANLGYERRREGLAYDAVAYIRYSRDVILWQPDGSGVWRPSNFGAALYPGFEQELKVRVTPRLSVSACYTFLYSFVLSGGLDLADDKRLPMTPVHSLKAVVSSSGQRLSWSATASVASLRYLKTANVAYLRSYFTLDVLARWKASEALSFYAAADNVLDEQYSIIEGYPMPGTKVRIGFELRPCGSARARRME
jgi:vitamin B12 transporter